MEYVEPVFSKAEVDDAGNVLAHPDGHSDARISLAYGVVDNWRAAHHYPLNGISVTLKQRARRIHKEALVFQRLKRFPSILYKLQNRNWISLAEMQDLGGCRAVVNSVDSVLALRDMYFDKSITHRFKRETNYIAKPKADGYRGVHLIYYFVGSGEKAEKYAEREMQIEIQLRTQLQHYWATAVETAETFTGNALKSSPNKGKLTGWKEFFSLVSSCFARDEGQPAVPGTPDTHEHVVARLKELEAENHYCNQLETFNVTANETGKHKGSGYFLLMLDPEARRLEIFGFGSGRRSSRKANERYVGQEEITLFERRGVQQVLVTLDDIAQLKRAYPNYYIDTTQFVERVRRLIA